jgi:hypothetical protein
MPAHLGFDSAVPRFVSGFLQVFFNCNFWSLGGLWTRMVQYSQWPQKNNREANIHSKNMDVFYRKSFIFDVTVINLELLLYYEHTVPRQR